MINNDLRAVCSKCETFRAVHVIQQEHPSLIDACYNRADGQTRLSSKRYARVPCMTPRRTSETCQPAFDNSESNSPIKCCGPDAVEIRGLPS